MLEMNLPQAQLFRLLVSFFGEERVLFQMSTLCVCGGEIPEWFEPVDFRYDDRTELEQWAFKRKCLFTVVDGGDNPRMVVEFAPDFDDVIDMEALETHRLRQPLFSGLGIKYITISSKELNEILDPKSTLDLVSFLQAKVHAISDQFAYQEE